MQEQVSSAKGNAVGKRFSSRPLLPHMPEKNLGPGSSHKLYLFYDYDHAKALLISHKAAKESPTGGARGDLPSGFLSPVCPAGARRQLAHRVRQHRASQRDPCGCTRQHPPLRTHQPVLVLLHPYFCPDPLPRQFFSCLKDILEETWTLLLWLARTEPDTLPEPFVPQLSSPDPAWPGDISPVAGAAVASPCRGRALPVRSHLCQTQLSCRSRAGAQLLPLTLPAEHQAPWRNG